MTHAITPVVLTDNTFVTEVLNSSVPVLVDVWAPWCGPCRVISPIVEDLAQAFDGRAKVAKLNIDENEAIATQYGVQAIPTLLIFQDGEVVDRVVGLASKAVLTEKLNQVLDSETLVTSA
ncbi:MAG: thioredoxin [Leptolyngbyaceae bacterium]|nr:thioredoxin [Leptolyngbyaceae bacterium]